jgi:hypothetical protein
MSIAFKRGQESGKGDWKLLILDSNNRTERETGNFASITLSEAASLLQIDAVTLELWSDIGLFETIISPEGERLFKYTELLTYLPAYSKTASSPGPTVTPAVDIAMIHDREEFARMTAKALTELTKKSVYKIGHLTSAAATGN